MFNIQFHFLGNIIPVSNISDSCHGNLAHELIGKTRQLGFEKSDDMTIALDLTIWQD